MAERATKLARTVRGVNVITACVQFSAGVRSLTDLFTLDVAGFLIAVFAVLFALLLLCFEFHLKVTDNVLRPNFGFLYGYRGMATYLLFIGLLDLGMVGHILGTIAGTLACINACLVVVVGICAPRVSIEYPAIIINKSVTSYGTSSQLQGPIAFALASGTLKVGTAPASVHAIV
ncbi:hypothetical protein BBJ29_001275 [Phytophthora kernoviae]|uniref:Uncharacterized protein n=1 Tax=Phytophthora kernoviae TaxID=325452 RepID=A0A3F2RTD4_9STRA|nr:hypothetical protein BBJ29_001275 [Phytophthora kernoviae]RLN63833.1 hypothetical protein BBP00_00003843 [Phytophthora kernoviae]